VRILDHVRLSKLVEVNLTEGEGVVVHEFVVLWSHILFSWLDALFFFGKTNLGFSAVGDSLDRHDTSSLSQLANWRHLSCLESLGTSELQGALLACQCTQLMGTLITQSLGIQSLLGHGLVSLLSTGDELVDRIGDIGRPSGHLGGQATDLVKDLLSSKRDLGESRRSPALRHLIGIGGCHARSDLSLIGVGFGVLRLSASDLDSRTLIRFNIGLVFVLVWSETGLLDISD
jgi:hypothetical protein